LEKQQAPSQSIDDHKHDLIKWRRGLNILLTKNRQTREKWFIGEETLGEHEDAEGQKKVYGCN
jgi:hypothetical protein